MIPRSYADWVHYYDLIIEDKIDFSSALEVLQQGTLEWNPGIAAKMVHETFLVVEYKLKKVTEIFQRDMNHAYGSEHEIIKAIVNARNGFNTVRALCNLKVFPHDVVSAFNKTVDDYIHSSQQNLIDLAKEDRTGLLSSIFKHNQLTTPVLNDSHKAGRTNEISQHKTQNNKTGRRVLF